MLEHDPYADVQPTAEPEDTEADHEFVSEMERPAFRKHIWKLLEMCGIFRTSFGDAMPMAFNEGQRNIGLFYLAKIQSLCPQRFSQMMQENELSKTATKVANDAK